MKIKLLILTMILMLAVSVTAIDDLASLTNKSESKNNFTCSDSDGGENFYILGLVSYCTNADNNNASVNSFLSVDGKQKCIEKKDFCVDSTTLVEYMCKESEIYSETFNCPEICSNGICKELSDDGITEKLYINYTINTIANPVKTEFCYESKIKVKVFGIGQNSGSSYSDALYVFTDYAGNEVNPWLANEFQMHVNGKRLSDLLGISPEYNEDHIYEFALDSNVLGKHVTFSQGDSYTADNWGGLNVVITADEIVDCIVAKLPELQPIPKERCEKYYECPNEEKVQYCAWVTYGSEEMAYGQKCVCNENPESLCFKNQIMPYLEGKKFKDKLEEKGKGDLSDECKYPYDCQSNFCYDNQCRKYCDGCYTDYETCAPHGTRLDENQFCDIDRQIKSQKDETSKCNNNYECTTNLCINSQCLESGLVQKLLNWLRRFFS